MKRRKIFAVIDVETAGKGVRNNRITEICIVRIENGIVTEKFVSLVNPERRIPNYRTEVTGIDDNVVSDAPTFSEIAEEVDRLTYKAIFVGYNASFDYHVVRSEFRYLGYNYLRPKLCTLRLTKKLIPNLFSYKLGNICSSLGIPFLNAHRAEDNADATAILFERLLALDEDSTAINAALSLKKAAVNLPDYLEKEQFTRLPTVPGIYMFLNREGEIIYIGKAKNIKKRVSSHFQGKSEKSIELCAKICGIECERTGSELVALLLEADLIKKHQPRFNTIQKKNYTAYHIKSYRRKSGILQLAVEECPAIHEPCELFFSKGAAKKKLEKLCEHFNLCPKFSGLQRRKGKCAHVRFPHCAGVCCGLESVFDYNARVEKAKASLKANTDSYLIQEKGRQQGESGLIFVSGGVYQGFGFVEPSQQINSVDEMIDLIVPRKNTYHAMQILKAYRKKHPSNVNLLPVNVST